MSLPERQFGPFDTAIIGGGFFGCSLALAFAAAGAKVVIAEKEGDLLTRASYVNQARVHNGYHYPRSLLTAARSAFNYPRFLLDFHDCVDRSFTQIYGIARGNSKVSPYQYRRFCEAIGIPLKPAPDRIARLFNPDRIEEVFSTEECAFDATRLRARFKALIEQHKITVLTGLEIDRVTALDKTRLVLHSTRGDTLEAEQVFNCTYSQTNRLLERSHLEPLPLKYEMTEMAMIEVPAVLRNTGVTIMDGPYFSLMPFPALGLHSLSHVTYTPHESWTDTNHPNRWGEGLLRSRSIFMQRDAQRYMPVLASARYVRSLFETKTVLQRNEVDDGRPILCRQNHGLRNFHVILGAKIDNIYDVLKTLGRSRVLPVSDSNIDSIRYDDVLVSVAAVLPSQAQDLEKVIDRVREVISRCVQHYEVLLIDSGSAMDVSPRVLELQTRVPHIRLIHLSRAYGREVAIAAALEHSVGDYVVIVDLANDPVELIPAMLHRATEGFDAVVAEAREERVRFLHRWIARPAYRLVGNLLGFQLRPDESYFRLFSRRLVNSIIRIKSKQRYLGCLNGMVGFRQSTLPYDRANPSPRHAARDLLRQLRTASGILVSNSAAPLRFASLLGLLACLANIGYLFYILAVTLVKKRLAEGWLTTSISQTIMFLMLFLIMSILSEYIARILDETKEQPLYFVEYETHSTVATDIASPAVIAVGAAAGASSGSTYQNRLNVV